MNHLKPRRFAPGICSLNLRPLIFWFKPNEAAGWKAYKTQPADSTSSESPDLAAETMSNISISRRFFCAVCYSRSFFYCNGCRNLNCMGSRRDEDHGKTTVECGFCHRRSPLGPGGSLRLEGFGTDNAARPRSPSPISTPDGRRPMPRVRC